MPASLGQGQEVFANSTSGVVTAGGTTAVSAGTVQSWTVTVVTAFGAASASATPNTFFYVSDPAAPSELILVTTCPGGTGAGQAWTVTRGAQNTTPVAHAGGFTVTQVISSDTLQNLQSLPWYNVVTMYGADPTGVVDCGAAVATAIAQLPPTGAIIYFPAGTYLNAGTNWTISLSAVPEEIVTVIGDGMRTTKINWGGTGACFTMHCPSTGALNYGGSGFRSLTIDGTGNGNVAVGIEVGDFEMLEIHEVQVQNLATAGSIGIHLLNVYTWTEEADVRMSLINNASNAVFEVTTGNISFGYGSYDFNLWMHANQDGVVLKNGAYVYHGTLRLRGNTDSSASAMTNAVLRMSGVTGAGAQGGAGQSCLMVGEHLIVQVEQASVNANHATTIIMDSNAVVKGCYGTLDFSWGGAAYTPASFALISQFDFVGVMSGDINLNPAASYDKYVYGATSPISYATGIGGSIWGYTGTGFPTVMSDMFFWTLTANISGNVTSTFYNGTATKGCSQRVTIIIKQAASGGPFTVTWQHNASPTVSAPTIKWAGGTAPTMTATASAVDVYHLETLDGITWYGRAEQNVS